MSSEKLEQLKIRLNREDEAKEEVFQGALEEIRESQAPWRAEREAKEWADDLSLRGTQVTKGARP
jgi:hypothetical protein